MAAASSTRASIQGQAGCALAGRQRQGQTTPPSHTPTDLGVQSVTAGQRIDVDARAVNWNIVHLQGVRESQRSDSIADMRSASHRTNPNLNGGCQLATPLNAAPEQPDSAEGRRMGTKRTCGGTGTRPPAAPAAESGEGAGMASSDSGCGRHPGTPSTAPADAQLATAKARQAACWRDSPVAPP